MFPSDVLESEFTPGFEMRESDFMVVFMEKKIVFFISLLCKVLVPGLVQGWWKTENVGMKSYNSVTSAILWRMFLSFFDVYIKLMENFINLY